MGKETMDKVLETIPFGVMFQDSRGKIFRHNALAMEILGLNEDQLIGRSSVDPEWLSIKEDGSPFPGEDHPAMLALKSKRPVKNVIMGLQNPKESKTTWIRIDAEPVIKSGKLDYVVSYFSDISESIEANEELTFSRRISSFLSGASKSLNQASESTMNELLPSLLESFGSILEVDRCYIRCFESTLPQKKTAWNWCSPSLEGKAIEEGGMEEIMSWCFEHHCVQDFLIIDENHKKAPNQLMELMVEREIGAVLIFPMINSNREVSGFAAMDLIGSDREFAPRAIKAMEFFSDLLSSFFDRLKSFWNLRECIKELNCIYEVSKVATQEHGLEFDFLAEAIKLIPKGFLYPDDTLIELKANDQIYRSKALQKPLGKSYQSELQCPSIGLTFLKATLTEGLEFLPEEYVLLDRLADILQTEMQRRAFTHRLQQSNARFGFIAKSESIYFLRVGVDGKLIDASEKYIEEFSWIYDGSPVGHSVSTSICDYDLPRVQKMVTQCMAQPGKIVSGEMDKPKQGGGVYQTFWEFRAMQNSRGEVTEIQCLGLDISTVKSAERLAQRFKTVSDQSSNGAVLSQFNGEIEYVNASFCRLSGLEPAELIGKQVKEILHSDFYEKLDGLRLRLEQNEQLTNEIIKLKFSNAKEIDVLLNANFIKKGRNPYVYYSVLDISARLRQEQQILEQNSRLEAILRALPDQVFILDKEGNYLEYYPGFNSQDRDSSFLIGRNIKNILPIEVAQETLKLSQESLKTKEVRSYRYEQKMDGESCWFETVITPIDDQKVLRFLRDVTVQKEYEEQLLRFNIAIHQSPVGIVIANLKGIIEYVSPSNENISGYRPEDLVGLSVRIFSAGKTAKSVYKEMWDKLSEGITWSGELLNCNKAGEEYWERLSITPMKDETGKVNRYMALKQNIHAERQFQENLIQQNKIFRKISNQQSHDVRGPIARILGIIDLIKDSDLGEKELQEYIEAIDCSAHELDQITRSIVNLSAEASRIIGMDLDLNGN